MADKYFYVGTVGPLIYEDTDVYPDSEPMEAFRGSQIYIEDEPTEDYHVARKVDLDNLPAGSDTQVQFNDGGAFGADAGLIYLKLLDRLRVVRQLLLYSENPLYSYTEPEIVFYDNSGTSGNKGMRLNMNSGPEIGNFPGLQMQDINDDLSWKANRWVMWKDGSIHFGGITRPSAVGNVKISSGALEVAGYNVETDKQLKSTVASGTIPVVVSSVTKCTNLNADMVDTLHDYDLCAATGWTTDNGTWTYASSTTFTVSGDKRSRFQVGTKLKWIQTTTRYAYVKSSTYSSPNTTVTIQAGSDYTIANDTIKSPYYSYAANPQGFPAFFNYSETWAGFSTAPSGGSCQFYVNGREAVMIVQRTTNGTSNATTATISLPFDVASGVATHNTFGQVAVDNGSFDFTYMACSVLVAGASTASLLRDPDWTVVWTNSGKKNWIGVIRWVI